MTGPTGEGMHVRRLGELEAEIMDRLWAWQPVSYTHLTLPTICSV